MHVVHAVDLVPSHRALQMIANSLLHPRLNEFASDAWSSALIQQLSSELELKGVVRMPALIDADTLRGMQVEFANRLSRMRWNNIDGFERTEKYRKYVQDVLTLHQGFVDVALHPLVKGVLERYLGPRYVLCEAKGWESLPTNYDFHGWHGDMWFDKSKVIDVIPREIKLCCYLSDVKSGAFQYITGSHGKIWPHNLSREEVAQLPMECKQDFLAPAGTVILFDTTGIHRQAIPVLEPRQAFFFNYHDPSYPIMPEETEYYRYHPLMLNAAFLGGLSAEDCRVLGFGNKTNYQAGNVRPSPYPRLQSFLQSIYTSYLHADIFRERIVARLRRMVGAK